MQCSQRPASIPYRNRPFPIRIIHLYRKVRYVIPEQMVLPIQSCDTTWGGRPLGQRAISLHGRIGQTELRRRLADARSVLPTP